MRRVLAAGALIAGLALSAAARADIMQLIFTGVIAQDAESAAPLFGLTPQNILGQNFTYSLVYDTTLGEVGTVPLFNGPALLGPAAPAPDMILSQTLAVDQQTLNPVFPTAGRSVVVFASSDGGGPVEICGGTETDPTGVSSLSACAITSGPLPADFVTPFGPQSTLVDEPSIFVLHLEGMPQGTLSLAGDVTAIEIDRLGDSPGVPEPSAWALMLTGFFAAGAGLRMRRRGLAA